MNAAQSTDVSWLFQAKVRREHKSQEKWKKSLYYIIEHGINHMLAVYNWMERRKLDKARCKSTANLDTLVFMSNLKGSVKHLIVILNLNIWLVLLTDFDSVPSICNANSGNFTVQLSFSRNSEKLYSLVLFNMVEISEFLLSTVGNGTIIPDLDIALLGSFPLGYWAQC